MRSAMTMSNVSSTKFSKPTLAQNRWSVKYTLRRVSLREPLNKSSVFPRIQVRCAEQVEESGKHEAEDTGDDERIRAVQQEDAASGISGRDGAGGAVGGVVCADRAGISEGGQRAAAGGSGAD